MITCQSGEKGGMQRPEGKKITSPEEGLSGAKGARKY